MPPSTTLEVGQDVHKASSAIADVAPDHGAEVVFLGSISTRQGDLAQLIRKRPSTATPLVFVEEAGPCGDWLYRDLTTTGQTGWGVAPSLLPNKAGDRVNTDRRDARQWACLRRSGDLTPIALPAVEDEALRDLRRAREEAIRELNAAKGRLNAFLRQPDRRYPGRATGGPAPRRGLSEGICATPAKHSVFQKDVRAVTEPTPRLERLEQARQAQTNTWRRLPVVEALQALQGVQGTGAVTLVAERGDLTRFENPRPRMSDVGVIPSDRQCSGLQIPVDERQYPSIRDPRFHPAHHLIVIHPIKELLQIQVHDPAITRVQILLGLGYGLVGRAPRTKAVAPFRKGPIPCRL